MSSVETVDRDASLGRRVGWIALGQTCEKVSQLLMIVVLARVLSSQDWNTLALMLTVYVVGVTLASFNLEHSIMYFVPRLDVAQGRALVSRTFISLVGSGFIAGATLVVLESAFGLLGSMRLALLLAVAFTAEPPTAICGPTLLARGRVRASGTWDASMSVLQLGAVLGPALAGAGATATVAGLAVAALVRFATSVVVLRPRLEDLSVADEGMLRSQFMFCIPLGLTLAAGVLAKSADKWMIAVRLPEMVGTYVVAAQEIPVLAVLPYAGGAAIAVGLVRLLADGHRTTAHRLWIAQVESMCRIVVPTVLLVALVAPELIRTVFGPAFEPAVVPFRLFVLVSLHRVTEYGAVLRAAGRVMETVWSGLVLLGSNILLGWTGLVCWGLVGLTSGAVLAFVVSWIWTLGRIGRVFGEPLHRVFPWGTWCRQVAISSAAFVAGESVVKVIPPPVPTVPCKVTVFLGVVAIGAMVIRGSEPGGRGEVTA
ncbi:MAG: hypothetical protein RI912_126 [Actinomycetota bacterium]|jgi:PST family polysaccharide transporter